MKPSALWLIPAVALFSVGSLTYATSRPKLEEGAKRDAPKPKTKTVKFAHDKDLDAYLTSVRSYMLTPPRDGRFGASRVPTLHGSLRHDIAGYAEVAKLSDKYTMASYVVGVLPDETVKAYKQYASQNKGQSYEIPSYRATMVHYSSSKKGQDFGTFMNGAMKAVNVTKAQVDAEGYDEFSKAANINGLSSWVIAKAVRASDKSCYSCHANIKEGEPIGHVIAVLSQNSP